MFPVASLEKLTGWVYDVRKFLQGILSFPCKIISIVFSTRDDFFNNNKLIKDSNNR